MALVSAMENGRHTLAKVAPGTGAVTLLESNWHFYRSGPQRAAKRVADQGRYMWDALIEYQASFVRAETEFGLPRSG